MIKKPAYAIHHPATYIFTEEELTEYVNAIEYLISRGKKFRVDFGWANPVEMAERIGFKSKTCKPNFN